MCSRITWRCSCVRPVAVLGVLRPHDLVHLLAHAQHVLLHLRPSICPCPSRRARPCQESAWPSCPPVCHRHGARQRQTPWTLRPKTPRWRYVVATAWCFITRSSCTVSTTSTDRHSGFLHRNAAPSGPWAEGKKILKRCRLSVPDAVYLRDPWLVVSAPCGPEQRDQNHCTNPRFAPKRGPPSFSPMKALPFTQWRGFSGWKNPTLASSGASAPGTLAVRPSIEP